MKTFLPKTNEITRTWYIVDATGIPLGKLSAEVAKRLRGKHKPNFTPHLDTGDGVIVINAEKIKLSGNKWQQKTYFRSSRYMGSVKATTAEKMLEKKPTYIIEHSVGGMIPRTKMKKDILKRLKVYTGSDHRQSAQQPEELVIAL